MDEIYNRFTTNCFEDTFDMKQNTEADEKCLLRFFLYNY